MVASRGHWLNRWRSVISGVPQGFVLRIMMFNVFINDTDKGIKCTLSKVADDIKQSAAADIPGDRMPSRGTRPSSRSEPTRLSRDLSGPSVRDAPGMG